MTLPAVAVREPPSVPQPARPAPRTVPVSAVLLVSSLGVLLVAVGYARGRSGSPYGMVWFWIGQALVFLPVLARVLAGRLREERAFALAIGLAATGYAVRWAYSPDQLRFSDELQHWVATGTVLRTGKLFQPDPALPAAVPYPGLEEMGAAVTRMTGLPVTASAFIVAGMLHLILVGAIFILVRRCGGGPTTAALTCVVYATGLHFLFFDSMYVYQTAALPFLMLALWAVRQWDGRRSPLAAVGAVSILVVTASHHVTGIVLVVTLAGLAALDRRRPVVVAAAFAAACVGGWLVAAPGVISYLWQPLDGAVGVLAGAAGGAARGSPSWVLGIQAAGTVGLAVAFAIAAWATSRIRPADPWLIATLIGAGLFFGAGLLRELGSAGPELAARATTFVYLPVSAVAAVVVLGRRARVAGFVLITVLAIGARLGGWPPSWALLPGPYLPAAQERSVDPLGVTAAQWTRTHLGTDRRIAADLTGWTLVATYGQQDPVGAVAPLYDSPVWTLADEDLTSRLGIGYFWVDARLADAASPTATLFYGDPEAGARTGPLPAASLAKFDTAPGLSRILDNGVIRLYQVEGVP